MWRKKLFAALIALAFVAPAPAAVVEHTGVVVNLQSSQTGNADSTNTLDRGSMRGACLLRIVNVAGGTPTVTVNILGSMDNSTFYNVAYAVAATPETVAVAAIVITSATTGYYVLRPSHPWRYLKLNMSANTNETLTSDIWCQAAL